MASLAIAKPFWRMWCKSSRKWAERPALTAEETRRAAPKRRFTCVASISVTARSLVMGGVMLRLGETEPF